MATAFDVILFPEDEVTLFTFLAPMEFEVYPETIPVGYEPFPADSNAPARFEELGGSGLYLVAERFAPLEMRTIRRGKDKGRMEFDEGQSPVIHFERTIADPEAEGTWLAGHLWTHGDITGDARWLVSFPDGFRRLILQIREHLSTTTMRSRPFGHFVGMAAARAHAAGGVKFREPEYRGREVLPYAEESKTGAKRK